jgi:RNA polymerase sigma-70 factor (ECF subfamily)
VGFANALFAAWNDGADAPLRSRLSAAIASARAIWPGVELPDDAFLHHLGDRLDTHPGPAVLEAIEGTHTDDLWLACACARGDDTALQHFDRFALAPAVAALLDADMAKDEVMQQLRVRLLVRDGDTPARIEQYGGRGSLRAWTRIAVLRAIKDDRRARARRGHAHDLAEDLLRDPAAMADPEMDRIRASYGAEFRAAFAIAVARLPADARRLLRQHHLHGLTLDALARIHGIHRVTAARRLAKARADLLADTRRELVRRLHVDRGELDRAVGLIMSRLELSLERMLASRDDL